MNGLVLGLFGLEALADDQGRPGARLGTGAMSLAINYETEEAVDQAFSNAINAGAKKLKQPQKVFWGGYSGCYADPDDHVWEIAISFQGCQLLTENNASLTCMVVHFERVDHSCC